MGKDEQIQAQIVQPIKAAPVGQAAFTHAIFDPEARIPAGLVDPQGRGAGKRFDVYRNNVIVSLSEALQTAFPALFALLGPENFQKLAGIFVRAHPPRSPLMMFYGEDMPAFLEDFAPLKAYPYLADLARIDLAQRRVYHGADSRPIDPQLLANLAPDALMAARITLAPAFDILSSPWPIYQLWQQAMKATTSQNAEQDTEQTAEPATGGQDIMISRQDFDPQVSLLKEGDYLFLTELRSGACLEQALTNVNKCYKAFDLQAIFGLLLSCQAIIALVTDET